MNKFPGGHRGRVPPVPIPNTEVKPATADGTASAGVWESRSLPGIFPKPDARRSGRAFSLYAPSLPLLLAVIGPPAASPQPTLEHPHRPQEIAVLLGTTHVRVEPR